MILSKKFISLLCISLLFTGGIIGQNIFDAQHSKSFADYLVKSQQYHLAAMELERIVFMEPENMDAKLGLLGSYRKAGEFEKGIRKVMDWHPQNNPDSVLAEEWIKLLILNTSYPEAIKFLSGDPKISPENAKYYLLATNMLQGDWESVAHVYEANHAPGPDKEKSLFAIYEEQQKLKYKKPGLAIAMSALVPGMGKVYSKDWKDGLISLLFVGTNGWQAYRGFSKDGIGSVYGWIFSIMTAGFYGSSIYGSWKSAMDYNMGLNHDLHHEIESRIYSNF